MLLINKFEKYLDVRRGAIHIGAHEGQERDWYRTQGFNQVLWFEPNRGIYERLVENIKGYENNLAFNVGVHDELKQAKLHITKGNQESSSILDLGLHLVFAPQVTYIRDQEIELIRMDDFFQGHPELDINQYNFLNIDVQGVELNVIKSFAGLIEKMDYVYTEVNTKDVYINCSKLEDIDAYLRQFDFHRLVTKMTRCFWGDAFYKKYSNVDV